MFWNVFLMWEANNRAHYIASLSPSGTVTLLLVLSPYSTIGSSFVRCSHMLLCVTQCTVVIWRLSRSKAKWNSTMCICAWSCVVFRQVGGKLWVWFVSNTAARELHFTTLSCTWNGALMSHFNVHFSFFFSFSLYLNVRCFWLVYNYFTVLKL